jgi:Protein of unknown function (DUF3631)
MVLQLKQARPDLPDELGDRAQDCWEPLLAVADLAGEDWPDRARRAAVTLSGTRSAEDDSAGVLLLSHLRTVFVGRDTDRLSTEILLDALRGLDESPWSDWCGKPLTARGLARLLKPYAIGPHSDGTTRGYKRESFEDAWGRYLRSKCQSVRKLHYRAKNRRFLCVSRIGRLTHWDGPRTRSRSGTLTL